MDTPAQGLSVQEAEKRLQLHGYNELAEQNKRTALHIFLHQFKNFLVVLLFAASIISAVVGEQIDAVIILLILVINIILGFVQEYKAENTLASLKKISTSFVRTIRGGEEQMIDSRMIVPGDIVIIAEGDKIPADGEIISSVRLEINEAALTGESLPVEKSEKSDDTKQVFMGTIVSAGRGIIKISTTGHDTRFGSMAQSLGEIEKSETPLTKKITRLGMQLSVGAFGLTGILFVIGIVKDYDAIEMLLTSISLLVAAVPEGLPAVITITLAVGLQRMARQKAILRKLGAIEALGNTSIIATDKTGTLTENKMTVVQIWTDKQVMHVEDIDGGSDNKSLSELIRCGVFCNNAELAASKVEGDVILGDQTEGSLLVFAKQAGYDPETLRNNGKLIDEFTFDSNKKMMSVVWREHHDTKLYAKGAPEQILKLSTHIILKGKKVALTKQMREEIMNANDAMAQNGLRVLACARREDAKKYTSRAIAEKNLTFLGLTGIADPPRKSVKSVITEIRDAGISTIMITGDNPLTAAYIGRETGIIADDECIVTGPQLAKMSDDELGETLKKPCVFARTSPEDKLRIVTVLQKNDHLVTVTGDGINDALALKQANVGVAMGITGTDVAKEVSDMVITDDNFITIVNAIREGRIIYDNIVKSIMYLVSCNLGEMLLISVAITIGLPSPLLPVQILWVNLVTDGLPALSLAFDPGSGTVMHEKRSASAHILSRATIPYIIFYGIAVATAPFLAFVFTLPNQGVDAARGWAFSTLVVTQMIRIFFIRPHQKFTSNKLLLVAIAISLLLQTAVMTIPFLQNVFHTAP